MLKVGDKVKIVGAEAFYGGIGGDYGEKVPARVKAMTHTIMRVSETRKEYLLREIYSWVPEKFIQLSVAVPSQPAINPIKSTVESTIVTTETDVDIKVRDAYVPFPVDLIPCYVENLATGVRTDFGISPEAITDSMVANFEDQSPKSRTSPFKAYANSGPRDISFNITLFDDYCSLGIVKTIRRFQALTLPVKTGGYIQEPSCRVVIGKFINIKAVCLSVSVEWGKPYKNNVYSKADVSFSFNEIEDTSRYATDWEAMS